MTRLPPYIPQGAAYPAPRSWLSWAFDQRTLAQVRREDEGKPPLHYERASAETWAWKPISTIPQDDALKEIRLDSGHILLAAGVTGGSDPTHWRPARIAPGCGDPAA